MEGFLPWIDECIVLCGFEIAKDSKCGLEVCIGGGRRKLREECDGEGEVRSSGCNEVHDRTDDLLIASCTLQRRSSFPRQVNGILDGSGYRCAIQHVESL